MQVDQGLIHGIKVLHDNCFTAFAVGLLDGFLDLLDGLIARQDAANGEETGLHDGVDAAAHAGLFSDLISIDHIEFEFLFNDIFLNFLRQLIPDFFWSIEAVQQEDRPGWANLENIEAFQEGELVAGNKVGVLGVIR